MSNHCLFAWITVWVVPVPIPCYYSMRWPWASFDRDSSFEMIIIMGIVTSPLHPAHHIQMSAILRIIFLCSNLGIPVICWWCPVDNMNAPCLADTSLKAHSSSFYLCFPPRHSVSDWYTATTVTSADDMHYIHIVYPLQWNESHLLKQFPNPV